MRTIGAILGGCILACSPSVEPAVDVSREGVVVETARPRYGISDDIALTIRNATSSEIRYSLCPGTMEHRREGTWLRSEQLMLCSDETERLDGGSSRMEVVRLPEGVERGEHRIVVRLFAPQGEALSNSFVVE